jgi:hypothetical protein
VVEHATQPRQIATSIAVVLIVMFSLVLGLTAYLFRLRLHAQAEAADEPERGPAVTAARAPTAHASSAPRGR